MWSANLISVESDQVNPEIPIIMLQFTHPDGRTIDATERGYTLQQMINYCKQRVSKLEDDDKQIQDMKDFIANPPLGPININ